MNPRLKSILDTYEDFELAFLRQYKLSTFMQGTRDFIAEYLNHRGLTDKRIKVLIEETQEKVFTDEYPRCPRCKSKKLRTDKVEWTQTAFKAGYSDKVAAMDGLIGKATYKDQIICDICDLHIEDPNNERQESRTIWKRIYDIYLATLLEYKSTSANK